MDRGTPFARADAPAAAGWMRLLAEMTERPGRPESDATLLWRWLARLIGLRAVVLAEPAGGHRLAWPPLAEGDDRGDLGTIEFRSAAPRARVAATMIDAERLGDWRPLVALRSNGHAAQVEMLRVPIALAPNCTREFLLLRAGYSPLPGDAQQALAMLFDFLEQSSRPGGSRRVDRVVDGLRRLAREGDPAAAQPAPEVRATRGVEMVARALRLTDAEARVVWALYRLEHIEKAADSLRISPHTLRTHLKHVFEKVGVHSRAALMVRVATLVQGSRLLAEPPARSTSLA